MAPEMREALEACRSLMPGGAAGPDSPGRPDPSAAEAFRSCMKDNGVDLSPTGDGRRLKPDDPVVAKALKVCRPLLPTRPPHPTDSPSPSAS
ncbi:hypothetical protein [Sphaerisporangium sp. TRM90804]|uniref:hypothetical protein n=1 Tax=Sphaerisporangium sp. TRM90804 TaxID=3031113 RepID=UPI00244BB98F|nr:hypothetical protein [Sphaerisporangium sp. TRM90804]MDH2430378.1 hypothetical protein [Sphaerisporangium sp. TRM90804]